MRKLSRREREQRSTPIVSLTVEALEPRVVLSASGFAFDQRHDRFELRGPDRGAFETFRPAQTDTQRDTRGDQRPAQLRDRHGSLFNSNRDERRSSDRRTPPPMRSSQPEGKFSPSTFADETVHTHAPIGYNFVAMTYAEPTIPTLNIALVPPPPRPTFTGLSSPTNNRVSATLPITSTITNGSRTPTTSLVDSPLIARLDTTPTNSESISGRVIEVSEATPASNSTAFVSFSTNNNPAIWNAESDFAFSDSVAFGQSQEPIRQAVTSDIDGGSAFRSTIDQATQFSEETLWTRTGEGGFIEISRDAEDDSRERIDIDGDNNEVASAKRLSNRTPRDAFWFDFGDRRLDLLLDPTELQQLAEEQIGDQDESEAEDDWLVEEGGMIVLTNAQFVEDSVDVISQDVSKLATRDPATSAEIDIPMDAGIGMFQAIDVATTLTEQPGSEPTVASEGETTAHVGDLAPASERAARAEATHSVPMRAASMPLLATIASLFAGSRKNREKVSSGRFEV